MEPTNGDLRDSIDKIRQEFIEHAQSDHTFQMEATKQDKAILDSLKAIHDKLNPEHPDYVNKGIEEKMKPILELYQGLTFGTKAVKWTSGIVLAVTIIVGAIYAIIKYIRG